MPTHPAHAAARVAKAARFAKAIRANWDRRPVPGMTLLMFAALLEDAGWADLAEQMGEQVPSPETRCEIVRTLALGEWVADRIPDEPALRVVR